MANLRDILISNLFRLSPTLIAFICGIFYWLVGYSLAYSPGNMFLGYTLWAGVGMPEGRLAHWFFQFVFAATAATILSGAVAERCNFAAYIVYSSVISGFVYPVVAHWAWAEGGLLAEMGYRDFAGSGVVHALAGVCSLVAAAFIGPRTGRFQNGVAVEKPGHSIPLMGLGGLLLISGFLAFNGGSLGHITEPGDGEIVARSIMNSIMAGSGAAVVILALCKLGLVGPSTWAFSTTLNATLAGIVSVCAGVDVFSPLGAIISGACACLVYLLFRFLVLYVKVDDPLDAVAVHLGGGLWGLISFPLFARGGIVYGVNGQSIAQLWHNLVGAIIIMVWSAICSVILFGILRVTGYLRVSEEQELEGLDIAMHNEPAYPAKGWTQAHSLQTVDQQTYQKHGSYTLNQSHLSARPTLAFDNMALELDNRQRQR
ncbi:ammonium transmembrane transporter activity protein [Homalodisca vitripennis]|nr:ammonium transmembrane transporter activity protein [Homalodisca vitripennis]